jgi:hypothetical protein
MSHTQPGLAAGRLEDLGLYLQNRTPSYTIIGTPVSILMVSRARDCIGGCSTLVFA